MPSILIIDTMTWSKARTAKHVQLGAKFVVVGAFAVIIVLPVYAVYAACSLLCCRTPGIPFSHGPCGTGRINARRRKTNNAEFDKILKQQRDEAPQSPNKHRRSLTPPPSSAARSKRIFTQPKQHLETKENSSQQSTIPPTWIQTQSMFFSRLPVEIRDRIYKEVIGNEKLHIIHLCRRLGAIRCHNPDMEYTDEKPINAVHPACSSFHFVDYEHPLFSPFEEPKITEHDGKAHRLALMKTCRRVYSESIPLLYSQHTFAITRIDTLLDLQRTILPHRFQLIQSLSLRWDLSLLEDFLMPEYCEVPNLCQYITNNWENIWGVIASLQRLRQLKVELFLGKGASCSPKEHIDALLAPCNRITQCSKAEFLIRVVYESFVGGGKLPWYVSHVMEELQEEYQNAPYQLRFCSGTVYLSV